jgi:hypothetical protein
MKKITILAATLAIFAFPAFAQRAQLEDYYSEIWCTENGGTQEVYTDSGTRADCVFNDLVVEVDFDTKWAEGLGQALHYSAEFDRPGGILLIVQNHNGNDRQRYIDRLQSTIDSLCLRIKIFVIETADYPLRD